MAELLVHAAPLAMFQLDDHETVVTANPEACRLLGYTLGELAGRSMPALDVELDGESGQDSPYALRESTPHRFVSTYRRKDGGTLPVEVFVTRVDEVDRGIAAAFVRDITASVVAQEARRQLEAQVLHGQKLESLGVLAGGIAHDFNNLLAIITGNISTVSHLLGARDKLTAMLDRAEDAGRQAAELCRHLLVYAGRAPDRKRLLDVGALIADQAQLVALSGRRTVQVRYDLAENLPDIHADESELRQVFMNLIMNAAEAIEDDEGFVTITTGEVYCDDNYLQSLHLAEEMREGRYVFMEVADTGCGMTREVLARLFDPFFTTKTTGRGLGLAAVLGIVRRHHGGLKVSSEVGEGTTFKVLLPVAPTHSDTPVPVADDWRGDRCVLLVDDDATLRHLGRRLLERLGFDVLLAASGAEALALYARHEHSIRCVLLDWNMTGMGGEETFRELRRLDEHVKVIFASGQSLDDLRRRVPGENAVGFVGKPFGLAALRTVLGGVKR